LNRGNYKLFTIALAFLFFLVVPFFYSFFFSINTKNAIEVNKEVNIDFIKSDKKVVLLFFGYVGCEDVCTPILQKLSDLYDSKEFETLRESVDIIFVNLTPEVEEFQPDLFAKFFNNNFLGVYLSKKSVLSIDRNFGLFFSRGLMDVNKLNHTDHIYLIQNSLDAKILKSIYPTHPIKKQKLIDDIMHLNIGI
jgi:protein SCO1/2